MAVCSEIHTNTLCGQNVELLNVKLAVHIVATGLYGVIRHVDVRMCGGVAPLILWTHAIG